VQRKTKAQKFDGREESEEAILCKNFPKLEYGRQEDNEKAQR